MVTEKFTVVALPHSKVDDAEFHVSLFISPQLIPDKPEGRLDDFEVFVDWAGIIKKVGGIQLADQTGPIGATPLLDVIDVKAWTEVFPGDTPVRGPVAPEWSDRHWRTFDAGAVHNAGKAFHLLPVFTSPTSPPAPSAHPIGRLLSQWVGTRDTPWDESVVTRSLDRVLGEGDGEGGPPQRRLPLQVIERNLDAAEPMTKAILETHRARRFYERPESALPYQDRPSENLR